MFVVVSLLLPCHTLYNSSDRERVYFALIILCPINFKFVFVRRNCRSMMCVHNIITMIIWFMVCRCFRLLSRFTPLGASPSIGFRISKLYRMQVLARVFSGPSPRHHTVFYFFLFLTAVGISLLLWYNYSTYLIEK